MSLFSRANETPAPHNHLNAVLEESLELINMISGEFLYYGRELPHGQAQFLINIVMCVLCFRNQLKADYLMSLESSEVLLEELGVQLLSSGTYSSPQTVTQNIDSVTSSDVLKVRHFSQDRSAFAGYF